MLLRVDSPEAGGKVAVVNLEVGGEDGNDRSSIVHVRGVVVVAA